MPSFSWTPESVEHVMYKFQKCPKSQVNSQTGKDIPHRYIRIAAGGLKHFLSLQLYIHNIHTET